MTIAELLLPEWDIEITTTRTVLERVPDGRGEWKPHEKSFPMAHLAQLVSMMPAWVAAVTELTEFDIAPKDGPQAAGYTIQKTEKLLSDFDTNAAEGRAAIARTTDEAFQVLWTMKAGGVTQMVVSRHLALRTSVINHLVHHRAQLGLYLRMVDGKVPSIYGPTADTRQG